jgi:hypothetical protein
MDLQKVRSAFVDNLLNGASAWNGAKDTPRRKTVAEDIFLRFAVGWENFISDWFIGAINHDASRFKRTLERKMGEWLREEVQRSPYARHAAARPAPRCSPINKHSTPSRRRAFRPSLTA